MALAPAPLGPARSAAAGRVSPSVGSAEARPLRGLRRVRAAGRPIAQTAAAAGLAWFVAHVAFGYERPFFASVAAVIALGTTLGQRGRRAVEMVLGVAVGIVVADAIILVIGVGTWQIVLVTALAMSAALSLGGSAVLVNQAAVSAILVATIQPPTAGLTPDRFFHAVIGGAVALLVGQVLFPLDPLATVMRAAGPVFDGLGDALARTSRALAAGDRGEAEAALLDARAIDAPVRTLHDALAVARETARLSPIRRGARDRLGPYADAAAQVDLAVRNTRVLARASIAVVSGGRPAPTALSEAVADLARGVRGLGAQLVGADRLDATRRLALDAVARTGELFPDARTLAVSRVVGQVRSTVIDLLRGSGMDLETAQRTLEDATGPPGERG